MAIGSGRRSAKSTYSPLQILLTSLAGIGGDVILWFSQSVLYTAKPRCVDKSMSYIVLHLCGHQLGRAVGMYVCGHSRGHCCHLPYV